MTSTSNYNRAPLIVVTLFLPSEAKTLAPIDIKRDLRRPPTFCQNFQRNSSSRHCKCKINAKPDLILCGKEITETSSNRCSSPPLNQDNEILGNEDKANDECTACSACMIEIEGRTPSSITSCVDEMAQSSNTDKYYMDSYGNLTKNLNIPLTRDIIVENDDDSADCSTSIKSRPVSPDASRIIRITLNNKTSIDSNKQSNVETRPIVPRNIAKTAPL